MEHSPSYPLQLEGDLAPQLNRGLWLVKWLLIVPHVIVLAVLWVAFFLTSAAALVAILITGRYPRRMFDYGPEYMAPARADTVTTPERLHEEIARVSEAGCDDLLLFPCAGSIDQVARLAEALEPALAA